MKIENLLDKELLDANNLFSQKELYKHITIENINCSELPPENTNGKDLPKTLIDNIFSKLHQYDSQEIEINSCPVVYVFELQQESDTERVINAFKDAKNEITERILPAIKNNIQNSKYLYVGKVEKKIGGRIVTHLGYYQTTGNHGLQLAHWTREIKPVLKLNLHVFRFKKEFKPFISAMEVIVAKRLKPIIGKH